MNLYLFGMFSCVFYGVSGLQLPYYIQKCSMSVPDINECIKQNGNLAIPKVVKGIPYFGIPPLAPLHLPTYQLDGQDVTLKLSDFYLYGFENFKISKVVFDLQGKKASLVCTVPYLNIISDYAIVDDKGFRRFTYGGGKLSISLVDNVINIDMDLSTPVRSGKLYIMLESMLMSLRTQRTHYKFDEISTNIGGNNEEFVMKHSKILEGQLQPAILNLVKDTFRHVTTNIIDNVPIDGIFQP